MRDPRLYQTPSERLAAIEQLIESVENRAMAVDGPVNNTRKEMTDQEMQYIYAYAIGPKRALKLLRKRRGRRE